jgi:hypothetical protein
MAATTQMRRTLSALVTFRLRGMMYLLVIGFPIRKVRAMDNSACFAGEAKRFYVTAGNRN